MKIPFSSHTNHISSAPEPHVASGCRIGQCRHEICPSFQGTCRLNARPTLSRFLRKQTAQNTFLQINSMTLSKTLKEMRRPSIQSLGRRENSARSTGCEIYQEWGEAIKICRTKHRGYKHIRKPLSNLFLMDFLPNSWYYCHPDPCSILSGFGWEIREWFRRFWFFSHLINYTHKLKSSDPKIRLENFNLARNWSS